MEATQQNSPVSYHHDHLFASYSSKDSIIVEKILSELRHNDLEIWIDTRHIEPGRRWDHTIRETIVNSKAVLYFVSPNSEQSRNVANELDIINNYHSENKCQIEIYPLWIAGDRWEDCVIVGFSRLRYYDLRGEKHDTELAKLIDKLKDLMSGSQEEEDDAQQPEKPRTTIRLDENDLMVPEKPDAPVRKRSALIPVYLLLFVFVVGFLVGIIPPLLFNLLSQGTSSLHTVLVTTPNDSGTGSLRQYVEHAEANTIIQLSSNLANQSINLTSGDLDISQNLIIEGPADIEQPMDDCINNGSTKPYDCIIGQSLNKFLKVKFGSSKGYRIHIKDTAHVIFRNILFSNTNTANSGTNTAFLFNEGHIELQYCWVSGNQSAYDGAGITNQRGVVSLMKSVFLQNNASGGDGGAIYNLLGTVTLDRSYLWKNTSQNSGGGISSLDGSVHLSGSEVSQNMAQSSGGGIMMVNGTLTLAEGSTIESNSATDSGGGIALFGANATVTASNIDQNTAQNYGAGILVVKNTDNNHVSSLIVNRIELNNPQAAHYIGQNEIVDQNQQPKTEDNIKGTQTSLQDDKSKATTFYTDDPTIAPQLGNPPEPNPPTESSNLLGIIDINQFCETEKYNYGSFASTGNGDSLSITCSGFQGRTETISTQEVCNRNYSSADEAIVDRVANYNDPTTLQCYKNVAEPLPITKDNLDKYCRTLSQNGTQLYSGADLFGSNPHTAYDWKCQPIDPKAAGPLGISITLVCRQAYGNQAFDRLVNYANENGWECRVFSA